jgi:DNA-binding response OmpR family regulator
MSYLLEPPAAVAPINSAVAAAGGRRILVVDDHRAITEFMARFLTLKGYRVEVAFDATNIVNQARDFDPNLLIIDFSMPEVNGLEAVRQLRCAGFQRLPVIMMTGAYEHLIKQESDIAEVLAKPFDITTVLLETIQRYV